jgi:ribonuclease HII
MPCSFQHEQGLWDRGILKVAGIDEAGRGPLAGPVVAAAVVFTTPVRMDGLDDSKKLTARKRESLYEDLTRRSEVAWSVAIIDVPSIDQLNILRATHRAMHQALAALGEAHHVLIDGLPVPGFSIPQTALVGGDGLSLSIAAASVIAKVTRDRLMEEADGLYPQYGFRKHKGYGTPEHLARLREHGPCPLHRRSFSPVAQADLFTF